MKKFLLSVSLLLVLVCHAQNSGDDNLIADTGNAKNQKTTIRASRSAGVDYRTTAENDLLRLLKNADANTKVAIAQELVERKSSKVADIFKAFVKTDDIVKVKIGTIEYESNTASELYTSVAHQKEKAERKKYYERTTTKGLQKELKGMFGRDYDTKWTLAETDACLAKLVAMALAESEIAPRTLNTIFYTNNFKAKDYARVKFFANKYPTAEILATLANFKNPDDVQYLTKHAQASYLAYSVYPHAAFFPTLQMNIDTDFENKDFQNAITAYKNADSKILLEKAIKKICENNAVKINRDDKLFQLYSIIEARNCRLYDLTLKKIDNLLK